MKNPTVVFILAGLAIFAAIAASCQTQQVAGTRASCGKYDLTFNKVLVDRPAFIAALAKAKNHCYANLTFNPPQQGDPPPNHPNPHCCDNPNELTATYTSGPNNQGGLHVTQHIQLNDRKDLEAVVKALRE